MTNGCINNLQMEHGMDSYFTEFRFHQQESGRQEGGFIPVDFARIAEGYGCKAIASPPLNNCMKRWKMLVNRP